jgi:hypothetical protein
MTCDGDKLPMDAIPWKGKIISSAPLIWLTSVGDSATGKTIST